MTVTDPFWPDQVIDRAEKRDLVLVIGAGFSKDTQGPSGSPLGWKALLGKLAAGITTPSARQLAEDKIQKDDFLDAAEIVRQASSAEGREAAFLKGIREATDGTSKDPFQPSKRHQSLLANLEPTIIVTTNFDKLIERSTNSGYKVHMPTSTAVAGAIRNGEPVLFKAHGSTDDDSSLVLTRTDFVEARAKSPFAYKTLEALLLTKTALFIGYSLNDPDILLLLENIFAGMQHTGDGHYWMAPSDTPDYVSSLYQRCYGINTLRYDSANQHDEMYTQLQRLGDIVQQVPSM